MKKLFLTLALVTMIPLQSQATRVAVTDSGTDFSHQWLVGHNLINENEVAANLVDDDRNGKVDDIMGWNFVEDYGKIFFPQHLQYVDEGLFTYFEVIARIQAGTQTPEDELFWKEKVKDLNAEDKAALIAKLNFYGQYAHSTHVSGIIASLSPDSKIMSNRVFPDTPPEEIVFEGVPLQRPSAKSGKGLADIFYKILAAISNGSFDKVATYLNERQVDVANYSLGISLQNMAKLVLAAKGIKNPTPEQLSSETKRVSAQFEPRGQAWMAASPGTLFVVAAGNDGSDNDVLPTFPANVKAPNSITVAASYENVMLADFSNYGATTVDIAAPGVAVLSSVPSLNHTQLMHMSGTSMAAPYIAGVAAKAKEINPALSPADLKLLMMSTVDHKSWLKGKVISEGVVNLARVTFAAEKSKVMSLTDAIKVAQQKVGDLPPAVPVPVKPPKKPHGVELLAKDLLF